MTKVVTDKPGERPVIWEWLHRKTKLPWSSDLRVVGIMREDGSVAGAVGFNAWQTESCFMHVAFDNPHALNRDLLRSAFHYPFVACGKGAVYALIDKGNEDCLRLVRKLGYREITRTVDSVMFEMLARDCRWIKEKEYGQKLSTCNA